MSELRDGMPEKIRVLIGRCEIGHANFSNNAMSAALHFGETCWRELCDFKDPTPLSELTDEQWEELGFREYDKISDTFRHRWSSGLYFYYPSDDLLFYDEIEYPTVKTLGQLRHLIAALGGEQ